MDKSKVPNPKFEQKLTVPGGNTNDIVSEILRVYHKYLPQLKDFAQGFQVPCPCPEKVAEKIWYWIKANIRYKRDPKGVQYIKSPARTIWDGFGDCKTYSIVAMSILHHLGIKALFRFTSYSDKKPLHHVYVVIPHGNREILLDAVWHKFNQEKTPIIKKKDIMPEIYEVAGIEGIGEIGEIASVMPSVREEIRKELVDMRNFLQKYGLNEQERQIINNLVDTFDTDLFQENLIRAIEQSQMEIFYTTVLNAMRMIDAPRKAEIGVLPLAAGLAAGRGVVRFIRGGGLRRVGKTTRNVIKRIRERRDNNPRVQARREIRQERRTLRQQNRPESTQARSGQAQELSHRHFEPQNDSFNNSMQNNFEPPDLLNEGEEMGFVNLANVRNTIKNRFQRVSQRAKPISNNLQRGGKQAPRRRGPLGRLVDRAKTRLQQHRQRQQAQNTPTPRPKVQEDQIQKEQREENLIVQNENVLSRQITANTNPVDITPAELRNTNTTNNTRTGSNNTMLFVVAGAAALLFLSKK